MKYFVVLVTNKNGNETSKYYFNLDYKTREEVLQHENRLDDFFMLVNVDNECVFNGTEFVKRDKKINRWFELDELDDTTYEALKEKHGSDFPSGSIDDLIEKFYTEMGLESYEEFIEEYDEYYNKNSLKKGR